MHDNQQPIIFHASTRSRGVVKVAPFFEARRDQLVTRWLDWAEGMLQRFDPVLNGYFSNALIEDDADSGLDCEQAIY